MSVAEIEEGVFEATATIDNGSFGTRTIRFETGRLAQQAAGAVVAYLDDETMLLSATTASKTPKDHFDFFPLTIDVEERMYAAGRIPGSFFRREGRPSTDAILTCRLIDRPLRPTFVSGLRNEIQVVVTILSLDPKDLYDVLAINAASASTQISGLPFAGPVGGVRVALIDGQWVAFPTVEQLEGAVFDMVVAGRVRRCENKDVAIMMVEAEATDNVIDLIDGGAGAPTESVVAEGLEAAKPFIAALCTAQQELADAAGKETAEYPVFPDYQEDVYYSVSSVATERAGGSADHRRKGRAGSTHRRAQGRGHCAARPATYEGREKEVSAAFRSLTKKLVRQRILTDHFRIDGRGITDIRALSAEVAVVPRAHGSALFERGETQILGVTTLDMVKMAQQIDSLGPETSKRYMHHYNFPPFSTGETGRVGSPKRREIGHGALAERALIPVLPSVEEFPYAIRQVSEALSSNGSTSMGSVCASTLALLNAGVPLKAPVAGIAMGLVSDDVEVDGETERRFVTLTDILGAEDAFGDMDFKCAGTKDFVTALQLDTKLDGIPSKVLAGALAQAKEARLTILEVMAEAIDAPDEMSPYAPRVTTIKVPVDKIGEVIGPKGKMINSITEETGAADLDRGRRHRVRRRHRRPVGAGRDRQDQRHRQPAAADGRRAVPRNGGQDHRLRRFRIAAARARWPGAHLQARQGQADREGRGRGQRRRQAAGRDRRDRQAGQDLAGPGGRGRRRPPSRSRRRAAAGGRSGRCRDSQYLSRPRPGCAPVARAPCGGASRPPRRNLNTSWSVSKLRRTTLPGGLRVVTEYLPAVRSASVGVWVGVGSRDEGASVPGRRTSSSTCCSSHPTRTAVDIAQAMDAVGGELNAFTAKEHTCYYAHVLDSDLELAVDLVADVVLNGSVRRRRRRAGTRRRPRGDRHARRRSRGRAGGHVPDRAVRQPSGGPSGDRLRAIGVGHDADTAALVPCAPLYAGTDGRCRGRQRRPRPGGRLGATHFGPHLVRGAAPLRHARVPGGCTGSPGLALGNRDAEQTHVSLGVRTPGRGWEHRWALSVLHTALGGGLSSRLFQEIRESRGLAYSVYSRWTSSPTAVRCRCYAACQPERFAEVMRVTSQVLESVARDGITEAECRIAKGSLRGGLVLGLEDSGSRMSRLGRSELNYGRHRSIEHTLQKSTRSPSSEVNAVARQLLTKRYGAAVLGPYASKRSLPNNFGRW